MFPVAVQEWGLRRIHDIADKLGRRDALPEHLETGLRGEREAFYHLRRQSYVVVARRWTTAKVRGDLDLIGWQRDTLCFVEVKSRTARDAYAAESAVDANKRTQLRRLARAYLKAFDPRERDGIRVRFDIVTVYLAGGMASCEILEGAFGWEDT